MKLDFHKKKRVALSYFISPALFALRLIRFEICKFYYFLVYIKKVLSNEVQTFLNNTNKTLRDLAFEVDLLFYYTVVCCMTKVHVQCSFTRHTYLLIFSFTKRA